MKNLFKMSMAVLLTMLASTNGYSQNNKSNDQVEFLSLKGEGLFPESILTLPNNDLLVSAVGDGSIQRIDPKGNITYFNKPHDNGLLSVLGMAVDKKANRLWVLNLNLKMANGYPGSNIKIFDLGTGTLLKTISENFVVGSFFNEIALDDKGRAYISNTISPTIYTATFEDKEAQVFVKSDLLENPDPDQPLDQNGLSLTPDHKYLIVSVMHRFMAGKGRLLRIDINTKEVTNITLQGEGVKAFGGSDGMFFYKKQLLMVNAFARAGAIMTADFNADYSTATLTVKDKFQSAYDRPTASAIRDGKLYTVNSQLNHIVDDKDGKLNTPPTSPFKLAIVPLAELLKN